MTYTDENGHLTFSEPISSYAIETVSFCIQRIFISVCNLHLRSCRVYVRYNIQLWEISHLRLLSTLTLGTQFLNSMNNNLKLNKSSCDMDEKKNFVFAIIIIT